MEKITKEEARINRRVMELAMGYSMAIVANSRLYGSEKETVSKGKKLAIEFLEQFPSSQTDKPLQFTDDELVAKVNEIITKMKDGEHVHNFDLILAEMHVVNRGKQDGPENDVPSTLTDDTIMVFGKFKKKRLADVPAWWLLWVEKQSWFQFEPMNDNLAKYIRENRDLLEKQMAENKTKK